MKNTTQLSLLMSLWLISMANLCFAQQKVLRKNIDDLTVTELATYEHAIQLMRDRSATNPFNLEGYAWQAWVHNINRVSVPDSNTLQQGRTDPTCFYKTAAQQNFPNGSYGFPGMCEHAKDIFFLWHRAQFYYFEKVLQNTDPEGTIVDSKGNKYPTKNLAVPFWNFTRKPSGRRFPKPYEEENSVLFHAGRDTAKATFSFTSPYLLGYLIQQTDWNIFGGYPNATNGGYGTFESQMHNPMHSIYVNGDMNNPAHAAYDPIFYSFHAYIDYILEAWIDRHGDSTLTSLDYFLRAEQPKQYNLPNYDPGLGDRPNMGRAQLYLDISELGYGYQIKPADEILSEESIAALIEKKKGVPLVFGKDKTSPFYLLFTKDASFGPQVTPGDVTSMPLAIDADKATGQAIYVFKNEHPDRSYQIDVYIHPKNVPADISSEKFRQRYFANLAVAWLSGEHHMHTGDAAHLLNVTLQDVMDDLYQYHDKESWTMTINFTQL